VEPVEVIVNSSARRLVVLIVDDDPGDVLLIQEALEQAGHCRAIHVANDGQDAVTFLRRTGDHADAPRPDVVLLDLDMPRKNGHQVLAEIKNDPHLRVIPIIVLSTSQDPTDVLDSYLLHANAYVTKPAGPDALSAAVVQIDEFFSQVATLPRHLPSAH
jgi:CheY-like chemotaxis protein